MLSNLIYAQIEWNSKHLWWFCVFFLWDQKNRNRIQWIESNQGIQNTLISTECFSIWILFFFQPWTTSMIHFIMHYYFYFRLHIRFHTNWFWMKSMLTEKMMNLPWALLLVDHFARMHSVNSALRFRSHTPHYMQSSSYCFVCRNSLGFLRWVIWFLSWKQPFF